jgi:hypothetical protein
MSDTLKEINWLRFYHQSEDALKDKDILKDQAHLKLTKTTNALFALPLFFQLWQISLTNKSECVNLYRKVRFFKVLGFFGAVGFGSWEYVQMRHKWHYYNKFYPEPTELQKTLNRDAMIYKENSFKNVST